MSGAMISIQRDSVPENLWPVAVLLFALFAWLAIENRWVRRED